MSKVIGIDLGSTMSSVAILENGKAIVVANEEGGYGTPSVIALKNGENSVGNRAKRQMVVNPKETIRIIKRFMGLTYDESKEAIEHVQYEVKRGADNKPVFPIEGKEWTAVELSSKIIAKMKKVAEDYLGEEVKDAVITVPAYFSDSAIQATKDAGAGAGLNVLRIVKEPTAALVASNIDMTKEAKYLVVDEGGATLDNSVADIADNVVEILATNGDVFLGGSNFDKVLADYIVKTFNEQNNVDISTDVHAYGRILEAAEKAKIDLSSVNSTDVVLPFLYNGMNLEMTITRSKFEQLITPFVDKLMTCANGALEMAHVKGSDLSGILLVGGSCRIPLIQNRLKEINSNIIINSSKLDLAVAEGAAIIGGTITKELDTDLVLLDVTPLRYGIETMGGVMTTLIEENTTIPCRKSEIFSTAVDNQTAVDIRILQGNRPMANQNKEVGMFRLEGIMPARRGVPQIEVTFDIDANGILKVSAKDNGTKKEQTVTIQSSNALSKEEIERMKAEAIENAEADKKAKEVADTINEADSMVFTTERQIEELGDKLSEEDKNSLTTILSQLKEAISNKNVDTIKNVENELNSKWHSISDKMYAQQPSEEATNAQTTETKSDTVQDAEFEEVK